MAELFDYEALDGTVYEGISIIDALKLKQADTDNEIATKKKELQRGSQDAIDKTKQQIQSKTMSGQVANTLSGMTVNMPQQDGTTTQEPAKPSNLEQLQRMNIQKAGTAPMSVLRTDSQDPNISQTAQSLGETSRSAQMSNEDIYSENQLTDKYSQVPEVQSYLENSRRQGLTKSITGVSNKLSAGEYGEGDKVNVTKLAGDFTSAMAEYMPEESIDNIQKVIQNELKKNSGSGAYQSKLMEKATPEDIAKANAIIDAMEQAGTYMDTPEQLAADRGYASTNPLSFMQELSKKLRGTSEDLRKKKEAIPINVENTSKTKTASNLAPEKLSDKNTDELTGQQNIFANLQDVQKRFNTKYLTPYIGKNIKMAYLKQNDKDFPAFTSSLGLAMNEYRRQNFGTAQTNSEIQNFLDVLNSDLSIKPEAFQKQLGTVMNAMKRDFNNRVSTKGQQNYVIPESLKKIDKPTPSEALGNVSQAKIDLAKEALKDPNAPAPVKAQAMMILRNAGVQ